MEVYQFKKDKLWVNVLSDRKSLGKYAAGIIAQKLKELTAEKVEVNVIFAAAPSQNEFLEMLTDNKGINWTKINAFHMDEYVGLRADAPQGFGNFLKARIFEKLQFKSVNYLNGNAENIEQECKRYSSLLETNAPDVVCMGIGENNHIAFNDPPVADFNDLKLVKQVELDQACRQQQVNDGCFNHINEVPLTALTLTIPALMRGKYIYAMVPGPTKRTAIRHTLNSPISEDYPSTILRNTDNVLLFVDRESYQAL